MATAKLKVTMIFFVKRNLNKNRLQTLSSSIGFQFNIRPIQIQMLDNPIDCDCRIDWLIEKIGAKQLRFVGYCQNSNNLNNLLVDPSIEPYIQNCKEKEQRNNVLPEISSADRK